jgi:hypothetical protein
VKAKERDLRTEKNKKKGRNMEKDTRRYALYKAQQIPESLGKDGTEEEKKRGG